MFEVIWRSLARGFGARVGAVAAVALLGAIGASKCYATVSGRGPAVETVLSNGTRFVYGAGGAPVTASIRVVGVESAGVARVLDTMQMTGGRGQAIAVVAKRTLPFASIASPIGAMVAAGSIGYGVGGALSDLIVQAGVRNGAGGLELVDAADQVFANNQGGFGNLVLQLKTAGGANDGICATLSCATAHDLAVMSATYGTQTQSGCAWLGAIANGQAYRCSYSPSTAVFSSIATNDVDWCVDTVTMKAIVRPTAGLCPSETATGATLAQVIAQIQAQLNAANLTAIVNALHAAGKELTGESATTSSGPATGTATSTTTTTTAGGNTTVVTRTTNNSYTYNGDQVTWNETYTDTTVVNGATTSTTTGSVAAPADPGKTDCDKRPNAVGCVDLGEAAAEAVPKATRSLEMTEETVGLPDACPSPITVYQGHQVTFDQACSVATSLRPFLIAMAAFGAAVMVLMAIRGQA